MSFSQIAPVYDRFNDLDAYENWLDFTLNNVDEKPHKVLDVACGTGWFSALLSPFVDQIIAIDIDPEMLKIAQAEGRYTNVTYRQGDMLDLSSYDQDFDLVTCYADSLCFLEDFNQVSQALQAMYHRLRPGGTLLFDVWTPFQVTQGFKDFSYFDSDEHGAILWDSEVDEEANQVTHYLTVFNHLEGSHYYERLETQLVERAYPIESYLQLLDGLGPASIEVSVDYGQEIYQRDQHLEAERWFVKVVKS